MAGGKGCKSMHNVEAPTASDAQIPRSQKGKEGFRAIRGALGSTGSEEHWHPAEAVRGCGGRGWEHWFWRKR